MRGNEKKEYEEMVGKKMNVDEENWPKEKTEPGRKEYIKEKGPQKKTDKKMEKRTF